MTELIVECVSKTGANAGRGLKAGGTWYSAGKKMPGDFKSLHNGDAIDADVNGTFINSYKLVGVAAHQTTSPARTEESKTIPATQPNAYEAKKDGQISRGAAINHVITSQYFCEAAKDMGTDEAVNFFVTNAEKFAQYIREGVKA